MSELRELSWADRFAVIDALEPTEEQVLAALDITAEELAAANELREAGHIPVADEDLDVQAFADAFDVSVAEVEATDVTVEDATVTAPVTATKPVHEPKKRGRKGTKIAEAFGLIDGTPVDANAFAVNNNVSLNVLRQGNRFDPSPELGKVRVKKIDGTLMIYRDDA